MKTLAVIMPRYANDKETHDLTEHCLGALLRHQDARFTTRITLVDDGSKIPPVARSGVDLIQHEGNRGIAVGWNTGWRANRDADFLCWINADCEVTAKWAFPLIAAVEQCQVIAMPYTNGEKPPNSNGITGWCFLTSKEIAEKIGPFDETFVPARYEDTDWFHRAIFYHHIPLANVSSSNVIHERKKGGTASIPRLNLLHEANRFRYSWKHNTDINDIPPFWKAPIPDIFIEE